VRKKLIEVAIPLNEINEAASREKSIRHGHPSTLHLWWARRPLAAARAVIFAQLVDDPAFRPDQFPTVEAQVAERWRLFELIKNLIKWENSNDPETLSAAITEIQKYCGGKALEFLDPFAGGGAIPLEAQRLGLKVTASDLNPVAVMINKAMVEIPPLFLGLPPINPESQKLGLKGGQWTRAYGLAEDVAFYAQELKKLAFANVGHLYPTVQIPAQEGSALDSPVLAWLWARTVKCPNPACEKEIPLTKSFVLLNKKERKVFVQPVLKNGQIVYEINEGQPTIEGTVNRGGAKCVVCQSPIKFTYIRDEGQNGRLGSSLMAIVAKGQNNRVYLPANELHIQASKIKKITIDFDEAIPNDSQHFNTPNYGLTHFADLFTPRQLTFLTTLTSLIPDLLATIYEDAKKAGLADDGLGLDEGGQGVKAYSQAITVYLSFLIDKMVDYHSSLCSWHSSGEKIRNTFSRQALPMVWDYAEGNPFSESSGSFQNMTDWVVKAIKEFPATSPAVAKIADARADYLASNIIISTDPPYYDNISYANLSDYFYIWLRQILKPFYKSIFMTIMVPKTDELIAEASRFDGDKTKAKIKAKAFFEDGLKEVFANFYQSCADDFPITIYYAFKQKDNQGGSEEAKEASSGWETMLAALIDSGFTITGTWPLKTELGNRSVAINANSLASSIVLVCRKRPKNAGPCSFRDFLNYLKTELGESLTELRRANIAPVDLAQAAIGPGMAIYSRYSKIMEPDGSPIPIRKALELINDALDRHLAALEGDLDPESSLCVALFSQFGFEKFKYGEADVLASAKNTTIDRLKDKKVVLAEKGVVKLLDFEELTDETPPNETNVWLLTQQMTAALRKDGHEGCAKLALKVGGVGKLERARTLAYLLFGVCEGKKWAKEAFDYNSLIQAWPEIQRTYLDLKIKIKQNSEEDSLFEL
jgi:putative DNA methylase